MNRAEKRRQQKLTKNKKKGITLPLPLPPSPPSQVPTIRALLNLGVQKQTAGNLTEAKALYNQVLNMNPNQVDALHLLGTIARLEGNAEVAIELISKSLTLKPDYAEAHYNLGNAFNDHGSIKQAINCFHKAVTLKPDYVAAHNNLASTQKELGNLDEAIGSYRNALALNPDYAESHFNLALILLHQGNLKQGWQEYKWRLKTQIKTLNTKTPITRTLPHNFWQGEPLEGKNILIYGEQGIGDEIMFAGCIPDLIELSPNKIFLDCDPRLESLFARSFPEIHACGRPRDQDVSWVGEGVHINYCLPIGSLPSFFRNSIDDFPKRDYYLMADQERTNKWTKRLAALGDGLKVGISWRGGHKGIVDRKSVPLEKWKNLLSLDACFINLQYGDTMAEIDQMRQDHGITIFDWEDNDPMKDLDNQAALISALDLVITVNNATYSSSGSLGVPTWDMVDVTVSPMMMINFEDTSPYYSSLRVFRKQSYGGWENVLKEIEICLQDRINEQQV